MLLSIAYMLLLGMFTGWLCKKLHLPSLLGMIFTGMVLGPYGMNLIDGSIINISAELRKIALIIILTRAGLSLNIEDLKKVGRPAVLMCFLPACFELAGMMILAGASVDDVFIIVIFSAFTGLATGDSLSPVSFLKVPVSILLGIAAGLLLGCLLGIYFKKVHMRDTVKVAILLCVSFLLNAFEDAYSHKIPFSALLAVMFIGIALQQKRNEVSKRLSAKFNKLWVVAEVILFVLVGATVDVKYALEGGAAVIILIFGVLLFRMLGVLCCLIKTKLNWKERLFCMIGYMPKATVQAAIGGIPLSMGLACGNIVLSVAVTAIIITAPLGALLIDATYKKLLSN